MDSDNSCYTISESIHVQQGTKEARGDKWRESPCNRLDNRKFMYCRPCARNDSSDITYKQSSCNCFTASLSDHFNYLNRYEYSSSFHISLESSFSDTARNPAEVMYCIKHTARANMPPK